MMRSTLAPDDEHRNPLGEVEAFFRRHRLTARLYHRACGPDEGAPGLRVGERPVGAPGLAGRGVVHPETTGETRDPVAETPDERWEEERHDQVRSGERDQAEDPAHVLPEATGVDEDEALATLRELVRELERDAAAVGLADDSHPFDPEHIEQSHASSWPGCRASSRPPVSPERP